MDLNSAKGIVLATLFIVTLIFSMLPFKLADTIREAVDPRKRLRYARIMSMLNCFAGGVFLGTCLLDLFPDVQENLTEVMNKLGYSVSFPIAEFIVAFGLFLVLITEQISLDCKLPSQSSQIVQVTVEEREPLTRSTECRPTDYGSSTIPVNDEQLGQSHGHEHGNIVSSSALRSLLLLLALSLHSIFEGLAIGLQENVDAVLEVFAAVILHKCVIAFSLSLNLVQSRLKTRVILQLVLVFCVAAPLGLGIGMAVMEVSNSLQAMLVSGILQGLACGTFLYVTFFEVLPHELNNSDIRMPKMLFIILGFGAACAVVFLDPDNRPRCYSQPDPSKVL